MTRLFENDNWKTFGKTDKSPIENSKMDI